MADRDKYLGDMDFVKIPYAGLLSEPYAAERRKLIDPQRASLELREGHPEKFQPDFDPVKRPDYRPPPGAKGMDALSGSQPFIMKPDGLGWLYAYREGVLEWK